MTEKKYERYYDLAGKASFENRKSVGESRMCGCYFCRRVFPASEVTEWISDTRGDTAVCPYCSIDSVIGDESGIPLREDVLEEIREFMFGGPEPEAPRPARCVGSGNYFLDTVVVREYPDGPAVRKFTEKTVMKEVGGTCGNVMCMLAHFGHEVYPQACLDDSPEGLKITADLKRYGCDTRFVTNTPDGGTTLLRVTHKLNPDGTPKVSVRAGSPGGSRFPKKKFLRVKDQAPAFVDALTAEFIPDFYFFDDPAAGHRYMARELRTLGTTVWFEPAAVRTKADLECVALSDIVKFSGEQIPDTSFTEGLRDKLFIQTLGKDGLRYKFRDGEWKTLPPVPNDHAVDWEGAGDWTSAAFIDDLAESGVKFADLDEDTVRRGLCNAQRCASQSVSYMGPKGGIRALYPE